MKPLPESVQAVVFDLDGTLLDTAPEFVYVVQQLVREHDREPLPEDAIRATVSDGARAMVSLALDISPEDEGFESQRLRFLEIYQQQLGSNTLPYPGITQLLEQLLKDGIAWGISTNKPSYLTNPLIESLAFTYPPASIVCPDHVQQPKPHPEPLLLNAEQLECDPKAMIYVGDHLRDIQAGNAAGMYTIAAAYGYIHSASEPASWGADAIAVSSQDLIKLIQPAIH